MDGIKLAIHDAARRGLLDRFFQPCGNLLDQEPAGGVMGRVPITEWALDYIASEAREKGLTVNRWNSGAYQTYQFCLPGDWLKDWSEYEPEFLEAAAIATPAALATFTADEIGHCLERFQRGDWSDCPAEFSLLNDLHRYDGRGMLAVYDLPAGPLWIHRQNGILVIMTDREMEEVI